MENQKPTIYAMTGCIGAGKTTFAKKLAEEKEAVVFLIDESIRRLGLPINSVEGYDRYYHGVINLIADTALQLLRLRWPVVLDFGGNIGQLDWLRSIADQGAANIEIFHLIAPLEVRRDRVRKRSLRPNEFRFSDAEFDAMPKESAAPPEREGLKVTVIETAG